MKKKIFLKTWGTLVTMFFLLASLTAATYAWFSANRVVNTDRVDTRSGSASLSLLVSEQGGGNFRGAEESGIAQVNSTEMTSLMPVSTADLKNFVYNRSTVEGVAAGFQPVENESYYYHGRVYLKAEAEGQPDGSRMALYLDESEEAGGALASTSSGFLLNAARLGITFGEQGTDAVIFYLSETGNGASAQTLNTSLNGTTLGQGQVLDSSGLTVRQAADPSVAISTYSIQMDGGSITLPEKPLTYLELNQEYPVDIYFYLEGCDPDCSDDVSYSGADLHLAFYGILTEE